MAVERCEQCGFDGERWTDAEATDAIAAIPDQWAKIVAGLTPDQVHRRPLPRMWSIAEYAEHVREVLFGMRFVLDTAVAHPGTDLGDPPGPSFDPEPRAVDLVSALSGIDREAKALRDRLAQLPGPVWNLRAMVGGDWLDAHWIARHAVHDATHHVGDAERLRAAL